MKTKTKDLVNLICAFGQHSTIHVFLIKSTPSFSPISFLDRVSKIGFSWWKMCLHEIYYTLGCSSRILNLHYLRMAICKSDAPLNQSIITLESPKVYKESIPTIKSNFNTIQRNNISPMVFVHSSHPIQMW